MFNDLIKVSGDFQNTDKLKDFVQNPVWQEMDSLWDFVSASTEGIGKICYEHITNFVQNIKDIDTCGLHQLYSIAKELNVEQIFSYDLKYPVQLEEVMNTLSVGRSFLITTGYVLDNPTLDSIYSNLETIASGGVSGDIPSNIILDSDYISGFVEPFLNNHLTVNSSYSLTGINSGIALGYQGFMDDVYSDPSSEWGSTTSAKIITEVTHTLRNIVVKASYQRETLKNIAKKHAMIGSTNAIEKIIGDYILRSFTKKDDWRLYIEPSGTTKTSKINNAYVMDQNLPSISDINSYFDIDVVEYWDNTEYMNVSAASPLLCGITGYSTTYTTTSQIDISGNLITGQVSALTPVYGTGLCGFVVTGGNVRFWEHENLSDSILVSENTSAEVSAFYENIGLTGNLNQMWSTQTNLWDLYATSGLNRLAVVSELTGTLTDAYSGYIHNTDLVPSSGWSVKPTSLSAINNKYIGTVSGDMPAANYKNQIYPTIAPQPFIWNLVEKLYEDFPDIISTLLYTDQSSSEQLTAQVNSSGDIVDSWLFYNQEYIGYQTNYEESVNLDYNEQTNEAIDRDGPFNVDVLSAYILDSTPTNMSQYYNHISKTFEISAGTPLVSSQLTQFKDDILNLSGDLIYQYSFDQYDNHYMLYKNDDYLDSLGTLWMRRQNHPLPFPLSYGSDSDRDLQQLYIYGGMGIGLDNIFNGSCYDFNFVDDIMWVLGQDASGNDKLFVFHNDLEYFPEPTDKTQYSIVVNGQDIPRSVDIGSISNYVGSYSYQDYIIFVYVTSSPGTSATFKFKHYNKFTKKFEDSPIEDVNVTGLIQLYTPTTHSNVWKLAVSEDLVSIAYEAVNTRGEYVNSIVTIDIVKNTLDGSEAVVHEWYNFIEV